MTKGVNEGDRSVLHGPLSLALSPTQTALWGSLGLSLLHGPLSDNGTLNKLSPFSRSQRPTVQGLWF